jgi:hypothetical protein
MLIMVIRGGWIAPKHVPMQQVRENRESRLEHGITVAFQERIARFRRATGSRFKESISEEAAEE